MLNLQEDILTEFVNASYLSPLRLDDGYQVVNKPDVKQKKLSMPELLAAATTYSNRYRYRGGRTGLRSNGLDKVTEDAYKGKLERQLQAKRNRTQKKLAAIGRRPCKFCGKDLILTNSRKFFCGPKCVWSNRCRTLSPV